ncbi:MAG: class IIb bacteriocin, lactobin A/cerein 7B family [Prolixibacteraceae bacterium]|jgi:lactobin A/cerein 7B family class IIb bacteriocin|nr:class IIb bacteriocin, lactobin A/cerein 7B family [Prolixibacteraceae bacterium]
MKELEKSELMEVDGGFVPLIIFGVLYSAKIVAAACGASFLAGFAAGIAIGAAID